ncbi:MAG: hydroxymethylpyrimidine/phosphomethylpyrimidine kinase, partial [Lachnospiraceae bacterium]
MKTVLTIAGSDCSGGAGIQGDIKTIAAYGLYSESVITALTAQNTLGVAAVMQVPPEFLKKQLECVFEDIFPDAVKIGMIPEKAQMQVIEEILKKYKVKNIVMDTVMISTSGHHLMDPSATSYYQKRLLPLADVMTPNIPEAEWLLKRKIKTREEKVAAALDFEVQYNSAILLK